MKKVKIHKYLKEIDNVVNDEEFVILDIETTSLSPDKGGYIIEVAAVKVLNGEVVERFDELINPGQKIYGKTIELTGITNDMLVGKPAYTEVLPRLHDFIGDAVVVGHNMMFDWDRFLIHYFNTMGIYPKNISLCTKKMFRALNPDRVAAKLKFTLSDLVEVYEVPFDEENHHRAMYDTEATAVAFLKMIEQTKELFHESGHVIEQPLLTEEEADFSEPLGTNLNITKYSYWQKKIGPKMFQRIYVTLNHDWKLYGDVFFDVPLGKWVIKEFPAPLDLKAVEELFLKKANSVSVEQYLETIGAINPNGQTA